MILDTIIIATIGLVLVVMWLPRLTGHNAWRAMVTPLASIIGSGFLVLAPILDHSYGAYAPLAMLALSAVAWGFGATLRYSINHIGEDHSSVNGTAPEMLASALLGFAYIISVAYYLNLLGAFALSLTPWTDPTSARIVTSAVYVLILIAGWSGGFKRLESMEYATVAIKLAIIAGLLVALVWYATGKTMAGSLHFSSPTISGWSAVTMAFGLMITVQGFETSRYLGHTYDAPTRIVSMQMAQGLATAIYVLYIVLTAYSFAPGQIGTSETAIVAMMGIVSPVLPAVLVAAALAAQFSAAVADTSGSGGLMAELSRDRIKPSQAYAVTVALGLALTWSANIFEIIAYASRAFAAYYAVQAGLAAWRARRKSPVRAVIFALLAVLGAAITLFGTPVE